MTGDLPRSRPAKAGRRRGERVVVNRQRTVAVRPGPLGAFLARACKFVLPQEAGVAVCLVTDAEIARLNRTYRGKAGPTDVLSFPAHVGAARRSGLPSSPASRTTFARQVGAIRPRASGDLTAAPTFHLGDIAISPAAARRNARSLGRSVAEELRVLILHGVLHLAGYDHETDRGEMDRRERRLRQRLGIA